VYGVWWWVGAGAQRRTWQVGDAVYGEMTIAIVIPVWAHVSIDICRRFSRQMTGGLRLTGLAGSGTPVLFKVKW
jgi:hypothetical protein